jgi:2-polyprenyl-3-methyl-5-hydroxy-6-metoxy-1,4-benzoquinol methylase
MIKFVKSKIDHIQMKKKQPHVFSANKANNLDNRFSRFFQGPYKLLMPHISGGMKLIDYGCGNGYFTIPLSNMVGA